MSVVNIIAIFFAFAISAIVAPLLIPLLKRLKVGQIEREELISHQAKKGTPTMGGIIFLIPILIISLIFAKDYPNILPILAVTFGFALIGFWDDYLKVVKKNKDGLLPKQKMVMQIMVTLGFGVYLWLQEGLAAFEMIVPFSHGKMLSLGWIAIPIFFVAIIGTVNGTNFTDGVDGLLATVTLPIALFFFVASVMKKGQIEPITLIVFGALLGFLLFNLYPAKIMMGDTGSLAIGGFVCGSAYLLKMPLFIVIVGFIYLLEVISVMLQVTYFKKSGGKRIFRMAPIHHHFELGGWSETRVVGVFFIITVLLCFVGYIGL